MKKKPIELNSIKMKDEDIICPPQKAIINGVPDNQGGSPELKKSFERMDDIFLTGLIFDTPSGGNDYDDWPNSELDKVREYCLSEGVLPSDLVECHKREKSAGKAAENDNEGTLKEIDYLL